MTWRRLPLFVWSIYATSLILVLATPVLAVTLGLVAVERLRGVGIFDPALGGDPLLFQHLFWFYSHPAVYIMVLPAMAVMSEIIPTFSRKEIFGYTAVTGLAIAKSILIGAFFMHLRYRDRRMLVFALAGLAWLALLFTFTLADYLTRRTESRSQPAAIDRPRP